MECTGLTKDSLSGYQTPESGGRFPQSQTRYRTYTGLQVMILTLNADEIEENKATMDRSIEFFDATGHAASPYLVADDDDFDEDFGADDDDDDDDEDDEFEDDVDDEFEDDDDFEDDDFEDDEDDDFVDEDDDEDDMDDDDL